MNIDLISPHRSNTINKILLGNITDIEIPKIPDINNINTIIKKKLDNFDIIILPSISITQTNIHNISIEQHSQSQTFESTTASIIHSTSTTTSTPLTHVVYFSCPIDIISISSTSSAIS